MQSNRIAPPKIIHKDGRQERAVVRSVLTPFVKHLERELKELVKELGPDEFIKAVTDNMLLENRRRLTHLVRKGMCERKNLELEIAAQAMVVWWLRLSQEEREQYEAKAELPV